jgi:DNA repair protein RecO (recombination protein O)
MDERATGIILRKRRLTETSLILHWLTKEHGRIATVAKGALRPKSPFRGKLDLFFECDLSFVRSKRSDLHTLKEATLRESNGVLRTDVLKLQQASYAAALIEQLTETQTELPGEFETFHGFLQALPVLPADARPILAFELKLLERHGQLPDLAASRLSEGTKRAAQHLCGVDWGAVANLQPGAVQVRELAQFLHGFILHHFGRLPRGRADALTGVPD